MFFDIYKSLCDKKGLSVYKVATELGLNRSAVAKWRTGGKPNGSTLEKMSSYFGVSVDYLLGNEKSATKSGDAELNEYLEELRSRPEMRMLFHTFAGATKEQVEAIVKAWEAMQQK